MATTFVTPDQDAIVTEIHIAAPAERVFQALTDPQQLPLWWNSEECTTEFFEMDTRPGGQWRFGTKKTKSNVNGVNQFFCQGECWNAIRRTCWRTPGLRIGTTTNPAQRLSVRS
ncbi:MAG: SRPBCC domain-containing protein [Terriglobales bacterium]